MPKNIPQPRSKIETSSVRVLTSLLDQMRVLARTHERTIADEMRIAMEAHIERETKAKRTKR